jgi:hypothetical protein
MDFENYYVIVAQDDNSIYKVNGFSKKREAKDYAIIWCDSAFIVCLVTGDVMKYSDNDIVKKAIRKLGIK